MNKKIIITQVHGNNLTHYLKVPNDLEFSFNALCNLTQMISVQYGIGIEDLLQGVADTTCVFPEMIKIKGKNNDNI